MTSRSPTRSAPNAVEIRRKPARPNLSIRARVNKLPRSITGNSAPLTEATSIIAELSPEVPAPLVALSLGSNLGDSEAILESAIAQLAQLLQSLSVASIFRTQPISKFRQPTFLNTAVTGRTHLSPEQLLACMKKIERILGRTPGVRFGPRRLDIDLLIYGDLIRDLPELTIPHPELKNRRFYLEPLAEIAPSLTVPPDWTSVSELLARLGSEQEVTRLKSRS